MGTRAQKADPIYMPDSEIAKRVSMPTAQWEATAKVLERSGLPKRDPLFNNQRCWPSVQEFLKRRAGRLDQTDQSGQTEKPGIVEDFNAFRSSGKRRSGAQGSTE